MGHYENKIFTAIGDTVEWTAEVSAIHQSLEGSSMEEFFSVAAGRNGRLAATLMPHGGKTNTDWDLRWKQVKVQLRRAAVDCSAEWCEVTFGGEHEGPPLIETKSYLIGTVDGRSFPIPCVNKWVSSYPENKWVDEDPDAS